MKKIITALLVLGCLCLNCFGQEIETADISFQNDFRHHEVYASAGPSSFIGLFSGVFVAIAQGIADGAGGNPNDNNENNNNFAMGFTTGYNYYFNKYLALGGMLTYEKFSTVNLLSFQAKVTGQYGWTHFKFYQSASAGIMYVVGADKPNFIFDITYLGLKADFDRFSIFLEGSFPSTAIAKAGATFKF